MIAKPPAPFWRYIDQGKAIAAAGDDEMEKQFTDTLEQYKAKLAVSETRPPAY
jgi:hypothetical protein